MQQRNALLKMEEEPDLSLLEIWEQEMARNGELLFQKRQAFVEELVPLFQRIYQQISGDRSRLVFAMSLIVREVHCWMLSSATGSRIVAVGYSLAWCTS